MSTSLPVFFEHRTVGAITIEDGDAGFSYDDGWLETRGAFPISVLMPLRSSPYPSEIILSWAANLLPENEQLRMVGRNLGVATSDVVSILRSIGRDTAGALSLGHPGTSTARSWRAIKSEGDLERIISDLPKKPFLAGDEGISMSLAGAQTKLPVGRDGAGKLYIPTNGSPSTHILKPDAKERLWGSVQNEAFCMTLAGLVGLHVPDVTTGRAGERAYLLVERFDRFERDGFWRRIHQEDFCQALGKPPSDKYESNQTGVKGPSLADMFDVARRHMRAMDVVRLLDAVAFNVCCDNTDAHAKNYAMNIRGSGVILAPIYDVMCASVWPDLTRNLAQRIGDKSRGSHLKGRHWQREATKCGLNPAQVLVRVRAIATAVIQHVPEAEHLASAMPAGPHPLLHDIATAVTTQAKAVLAGLAEVENKSGPDEERPT